MLKSIFSFNKYLFEEYKISLTNVDTSSSDQSRLSMTSSETWRILGALATTDFEVVFTDYEKNKLALALKFQAHFALGLNCFRMQ